MNTTTLVQKKAFIKKLSALLKRSKVIIEIDVEESPTIMAVFEDGTETELLGIFNNKTLDKLLKDIK